jgi:hypothetical protein
VHRECRYDKSAPADAAEFIIAKFRDGEIGTHYMKFQGDIQRFLNLEEQEAAEYREKLSNKKNKKDQFESF